MLYLNTDIDNSKVRNIKSIDADENESTTIIDDRMKVELIAKVTLDKRLTAKDMRVYGYLLNFRDDCLTQEQIADILDMSRSNINKSIEKLSALNYIEKVPSKNWKEVTTYKIIEYYEAGITYPTPNEIVRLLNVVNKEKDVERLNYVSLEDEIEYRDTIGKLIVRTEELEEISLKERAKEDLNHGLIKEIEDEIEESNNQISNIRNELKDVEDIGGMIRRLESDIFRRSKLEKDRIKAVLKNRNRKVLLFLAYTYQENIIKFREKYLENYIMFLARFTDDLKEDKCKEEPNEDFFRLYYESLSKINYTYEDIMKVVGVTHRDVPERKRRLQEDISNRLRAISKTLRFANEKIFTDKIEETLNKLITKCEGKNIAKKTFNHEEFILIIVALNKEIECQRAVCVNFNTYIKIKSEELYECIVSYNKYKEKYSKEITKEEE